MRKLLVALAVMSVALAATTYTLWRDRETERARADTLQARIATLESRRPAKPVRKPAQANVPAAAAPEAPAPLAAGEMLNAGFDVGEEYMALRRRLLRDPKYYEASRASQRLHFEDRRLELIRVLGVSPAKADEIVDYWIERRLRDEASVPNPAATDQELRERADLLAQRQHEEEERLRALVGDEMFAKLQEYTASRPSRYRTDQLRARVATGNDALRDDQIDPLIAVLHTEQGRFQQEQQGFVETLDPESVAASTDAQRKVRQQMQELRDASNRRIHNSAAMILSRQQLAELDAMLRAELEAWQAENTLQLMEANAGEN